MAKPDEAIRELEASRRQVERMGLDWREAPGGRSLIVRLPISDEAFPGPAASMTASYVVFATVGASRIKCLRPRPLFQLPMISIAGCGTSSAVEGRIREAWRQRQAELRHLVTWHEKLGGHPSVDGPDPVMEIPMHVDDDAARIRMIERGAAILPGRGPLSGVRLRRAEDRSFRPEPALESATELEIAVATRLEELLRLEERMARQARMQTPPADAPQLASAPLAPQARDHRVLLVGRKLAGSGLMEQLRLRGYRTTTASNATEALAALEYSSFELVLTDCDLGRYEGIELIPGVRALPGVEEIPLVLVDDRKRTERRKTAKRLGAAGYLTHPLDVPKIAPGLVKLVEQPRRRRYTRYPQHLAVRGPSGEEAEITAQIGRGGMLLLTERELEPRTVELYRIALPDGSAVEVEGEVVYRVRGSSLQRPGAGIRFHAFAEGDEGSLIAFLRGLEDPS